MAFRRWGWLTCLACLLAPTGARADDRNFQLDHLQLAVTSDEFLGVEGGGLGRGQWRAAVAIGFLDAPLLLDAHGMTTELVSSRDVLDVVGGYGFGHGLSLGLDVPVLVVQSGAVVSENAALGDLRLVGRWNFFESPHGVAGVTFGLRFPTATAADFFGENFVFEPRLLAATRLFGGVLHLGANLGLRFRDVHRYQDLHVGNELTLALAASVRPWPWGDVFTELHADTLLGGSAFASGTTPVEVLVGLGARWMGLSGRVAAGFGLVDGYGNPAWRLVVELGWRTPPKRPPPPPPPPPPKKRRPPPPPPPPPPPKPVEEKKPDVSPSEPNVKVTEDFIELGDPIFFDTNLAHLHRRYFPELRELVRALEKRPWIKVLWIEGHADATGPHPWNQQLSEMRAKRVVNYLVRHGADPKRLRVLGLGERQPWFSNAQEAGRAKNRRVMFFVQKAESSKPDLIPATRAPEGAAPVEPEVVPPAGGTPP